MTLVEQLWGSTNEKIHTVGTLFLALSAGCFVVLGLEVKSNGLFTFSCFAVGVNLIGLSMLRNAWTRWVRDEDSLVLLKKRGDSGRIYDVAMHIGPWRLAWKGRVAHVDAGRFEMRRVESGDVPSAGSIVSRGYQLFRAYYWWVCSTLGFQLCFGLSAIGYGVWLMAYLMTYSRSTV